MNMDYGEIIQREANWKIAIDQFLIMINSTESHPDFASSC